MSGGVLREAWERATGTACSRLCGRSDGAGMWLRCGRRGMPASMASCKGQACLSPGADAPLGQTF